MNSVVRSTVAKVVCDFLVINLWRLALWNASPWRGIGPPFLQRQRATQRADDPSWTRLSNRLAYWKYLAVVGCSFDVDAGKFAIEGCRVENLGEDREVKELLSMSF